MYWLNGEFFPTGTLAIGDEDRGLLLGEGIFDTLLAENGQHHRLVAAPHPPAHRRRLLRHRRPLRRRDIAIRRTSLNKPTTKTPHRHPHHRHRRRRRPRPDTGQKRQPDMAATSHRSPRHPRLPIALRIDHHPPPRAPSSRHKTTNYSSTSSPPENKPSPPATTPPYSATATVTSSAPAPPTSSSASTTAG